MAIANLTWDVNKTNTELIHTQNNLTKANTKLIHTQDNLTKALYSIDSLTLRLAQASVLFACFV